MEKFLPKAYRLSEGSLPESQTNKKIKNKLLLESHPDVGGSNEAVREVIEAVERGRNGNADGLKKLHKKRYGYEYGEDNTEIGRHVDVNV